MVQWGTCTGDGDISLPISYNQFYIPLLCGHCMRYAPGISNNYPITLSGFYFTHFSTGTPNSFTKGFWLTLGY